MTASSDAEIMHATTVALDGRAVLILGPSGSGKSALGLALMAFGCALISDDRTVVRREGPRLHAAAPVPISGLIEARGIGLLRAATVAEAELVLVVDLSEAETERLPEPREKQILGLSLPLVRGGGRQDLAPAILQYLKGGRSA